MSAERIVLRQKWKTACKREGERAIFEEYLVSAGVRSTLSKRAELQVKHREYDEHVKRLRRANAAKPTKDEHGELHYPYVCAVKRKPYVKPMDRKIALEANPFVVPEEIFLQPKEYANPGKLNLAPIGNRIAAATQAEIPIEFVRFGRNAFTGEMPEDKAYGGFIEWPCLYSANRERVLAKNARRALRQARKQRRGWA